MDERSTDLTDVFEKMFLLGVGAFSLTKEKIQGTVGELGDRGARERDAFTAFMRDNIRKALDRTDIATKADIERLETEIAVLRAEVLSGAVTPVEASDEDLSEGNL